MNFILWIIFGALAGWIASIIMGKNQRMGAIANIVVGIVGAFIGGWLMSFFGAQGVTGFNFPSFLVAEGICESPYVQFPDVKGTAQDRDVNSGNMFFWTFGAGHGVLEYYYLTGDDRVRQALIRVADGAVQQRKPGNFLKAVIFAARHGDDPAPYQRYLETWARGSSYVLQVVPHNRLVYGGPRGMLQGSVSGSLFAMNDVPYLLSVLPGDPMLSERQREALRQVDLHGAPAYQPPALDWQSAYDGSELTEYLRIKHPQP